MRELSGRQITDAVKITERHAAEFNALVAAVDECGAEEVRLNLTDLDASSLWKRDDFFKLAVRPNLTLILDPETAATLRSYLALIGATAKYEERAISVIPAKEDPTIQVKGLEFAACSYVLTKDGKKIFLKELRKVRVPQGTFIHFRLLDTGLESMSSIGLTVHYVRRAIELISKLAGALSLRLSVDFSDMVFEGGSDIVLADTLVDCRRDYKVPMRVVGDEGIAEYVRVYGNVKLSAENKMRFFKRIEAGTVLRLCTYRTALRSDITGRKGAGQLAHVALVIFKGVEGFDAVYEEIPTQRLYLPEDLEAAGEAENTGELRIPRRRPIAELGVHRLCTGSHGHFGPVDSKETYEVSDGNGGVVQLNEIEFVIRGFDALGITYNKELLRAGAVVQPTNKK